MESLEYLVSGNGIDLRRASSFELPRLCGGKAEAVDKLSQPAEFQSTRSNGTLSIK